MTQDPTNDAHSAAPISEQASDWWVTLNTGPSSPADHQMFGKWVGRSPERIQAFLGTARTIKVFKSKHLKWPDTPIEVLAQEAKRDIEAEVVPIRTLLTVPGSGPVKSAQRESVTRVLEPAIAARPSRSYKPRSLVLLGLAASVGALICGLWLFSPRAQRFDTSVGELRSVVLADGSLLTLNTASSVEVKFKKHSRLIRLISGEALFQVARDPARPFDVLIGNTRVHAVGTAFSIDKEATTTTVVVVEGRVAVSSSASRTREGGQEFVKAPGAGTVLPNKLEPDAVYLDAGEQLRVRASDTSLPHAQAADISAATAWTQRKLIFAHRPLGEVAAEFNRYNLRKIRIQDAKIAAEKVTGVFQATDPDSFLDFVSTLPGVAIERGADITRVSSVH